jgi:hypothetical protein
MQARRGFAVAAAVAGALMLGSIAPAAALTQKEAAEKVAEEYGVEVLKTDAGLDGNRPIILLTVMQPGGNDNAAFQVNTIAVDAKTGEVIPGYRRMETGSLTSPAAPAANIDERIPFSVEGESRR